MLGCLLFAAAFQVLPFYEQRPADDYYAVRPLWSTERGDVDVVWPVFTWHDDWWSFCRLVNCQAYHDGADGYQFTVVPLWFNGRDREKGGYAGLFPLAGYHPHVGMMYDVKFALWPLWHQYRMPRGRGWMKTNAVLFPLVSWRDDGAWSVWPLYGLNRQRESDHRYVLWPLVTWAGYREDRDTAGEGSSWMVWPLYGRIRRAREEQDLYLPPFFSFAETFAKGEARRHLSTRVRCPWPLVDYESTPSRWRLSVWPFWERSIDIDYTHRKESTRVTRFGWKLVELYDDETRVFPFWASGRDHFRLWPFWESETEKLGAVARGRFLALMPIRWVPPVDRNWAKFWTFYENESTPLYTDHSLLWGLIRWRTLKP
ncbi:MAG: hypothetical protein IJ173_08700 [Kiritimatiellae bacterium]|nr:hypothetical protein [Kiritimatiellia bacterium]